MLSPEPDNDSCGDLNAGSYTNVTFTFRRPWDSGGDGQLPNVVAQQPDGRNGFHDRRPGDKSKCNCDDTFQVPVTVEPVTGAVEDRDQGCGELPGESENNSATRTVKINSLTDDHSDITQSAG